ncbi:NAD-dependent epimerase/dehydratase family protein [Streptomyces sp. HC44]|uniref:NAD-dependent epimerase/dehydratase family protein n=1 Tax=Streptomyces scabichelini TaxID=2711217 RepID=A0A6G4V8G6_9ACTN|nr:NAD-dependent epimerase/dehydratase family protein [Streptomyces scabichelini]NGO10140.1 NAD-dependent epimerase/dehydratase family protein [Streptomyces scabichelini]
MRVFVTGGSGFLGGHLLRALTAEGHSVRALARSTAAADTVTGRGAEAVRGGLLDPVALRSGMADCDAVVHAAAFTGQWGPRSDFVRVNVAGSAAVVRAAQEAGVPRLVHVSSEAVLADGHPLRMADESRPRPASPVGEYARTKGLAEDLVLAASSAELTTLAVRPRLVWGPGDTTVLPAVVDAARRGRFAWVDGGHYLTSTCHAANASAGILAALRRGAGGRAYFLTDGEPVEFRTFLTSLAATRNTVLPDRSVPRRVLSATALTTETVWRLLRLRGEPPVTRTFVALSAQEMTVDDSAARRELGYRPVLTRDQGLKQLAESE